MPAMIDGRVACRISKGWEDGTFFCDYCSKTFFNKNHLPCEGNSMKEVTHDEILAVLEKPAKKENLSEFTDAVTDNFLSEVVGVKTKNLSEFTAAIPKKKRNS